MKNYLFLRELQSALWRQMQILANRHIMAAVGYLRETRIRRQKHKFGSKWGIAISFLIAIFLNVGHLNAEEIDVSLPLRITQLIPRDKFIATLAVDPAVPQDFVALGKDDSEWIYWGKEEVLKAFFIDPFAFSEPIIRLRVTPNFAQPKYGFLDEENLRELTPRMAKIANLHDVACDFGRWGAYPYCMISSSEKKKIRMAYVGLNHESTAVLQFQLIIPDNPSGEQAALKLWDGFFKETTPLSGPLLFKAHGQEMHLGYTIVDVIGRKTKVIAEKRKSDQKIRFIAISEDGTMEFKYESAFATLMGAKWHCNEPLLKIKGMYIAEKGRMNLFMTTSVLIKEVDEFTDPPREKVIFLQEL